MRSVLKNAAGGARDDRHRWPMPNFNETDQPHFLFIVTPPYSGSTALAELINTSHKTMILQDRGEGQWLVPGLCEQDRWDPKKNVNYDSVKAVWLSRYQMVNRLTQHVDVVIEKSPPHMVRLDRIVAMFRDYSLLANNRNPYANCSSILYRNYKALEIGHKERLAILGTLAADWLERSIIIRAMIEKFDIPLLTYEQFCDNPASVLNVLRLPQGVADSINLQAKVKVKDYEPQTISNLNSKQIEKLTSEEINSIEGLLKPNKSLLKFFGYEVEWL